MDRVTDEANDAANMAEDVLDPTGVLAELTGVLDSAQHQDIVLENIVGLAKKRIPGADEVSLTLIDHDRATTVASTGSVATELDERQYGAGWGPCLDAAQCGDVLVAEDTAHETRWPEFIAKAVELGVGSSISTPLPAQQHLRGALNTYGMTPHAFGEASRRLARSFAAHAALVLAHAYRYADVARQAETLQEAMRSRAVIEQAKGIFMAARNVGAEEAFDMLVRLSQTRHIKLRDLAAQVVSQASGQPVTLEDP